MQIILQMVPFITMLLAGAYVLSRVLINSNAVIAEMLSMQVVNKLKACFYIFFSILLLQIYGVEIFLTGFTLLLIVLAGLDYFWLEKRRAKPLDSTALILFARGYAVPLLCILMLRSFVVQPYRVPTGSLEPTVMPGDFILVNQYKYGIRWPITHKLIVNVGSPRRGDIVVFVPPEAVGSQANLVKRTIGLPGDHIVYRDKTLYINDEVVPQKTIGSDVDHADMIYMQKMLRKQELLPGKTHDIFIDEGREDAVMVDIMVPAGHYFMMGDNRDFSNDSRYWGFVPESNLIGKAFFIWMNLDLTHFTFDWHRIGTRI